MLSPNGNHQQDMLFRVAEYKKLEELPAYKVRKPTARAQAEMGSGSGGGGGGGAMSEGVASV